MRTRKLTDIQRAAALRSLGRLPLGSDNYGWHKHYAEVFNKTSRAQAEHLAIWYLLLHIALGEN